MVKAVLKEMRIKQYTKNILVYAAPLFTGDILRLNILYLASLTFIVFSMMASAVYILNDILDCEKDRQHPQKAKRPIASGEMPLRIAFGAFFTLLGVSLLVSYYISAYLAILLLVYFIMNVAYSIRLKHVVIIDVMIISFGFVLRAFAGAIAIQVGMTSWFILCVFMLSLFLALAKRRAELQLFLHEKARQRRVLQDYSIKLIDQLLMVVTAITLTSYSLFALQVSALDKCLVRGNIPHMMLTIPVVVYGVFRYMYLIYMRGMGGSPDEVLLHDKYIAGTVIVYIIFIMIIRDF